MNKPRKRVIGDMQLRGFADRTIEASVQALRRPARYFNWMLPSAATPASESSGW